MQFPLSFWDLSLWLAITSIILLATSEILSSYRGGVNIWLNKKRLKIVSLTIGILFMIIVVIGALEIIIIP